MLQSLSAFTPCHEFLLCVDSDGTAMDTMEIKHTRCLGPTLIEEWGLEAWKAPVMKLWYDINLYQMTRGVIRFKALALALRAINDTYTPIDGIEELEAWVSSGATLSGDALKEKINGTPDGILHKVFRWTETVNRKIGMLTLEDKKPFPGAARGLEAAAEFADIAVISTANRDALMEEWGEYGLLDYADVILAQDSGSKTHCIAELLKKGYTPDHVLMVGDAPGDLEAAKANKVHFYPILVRHETESWTELCTNGYNKLKSGGYDTYEEERLRAFLQNLNA